MRNRLSTTPYLVLSVGALATVARGQEVLHEWVTPSLELCARGDLNDDGIRDLVISKGSGIFAYSGVSDDLLWVKLDVLGPILGHAGDIDLDGKDDVLVGNPNHLIGTSHGAVFVLSGADGSILQTIPAPGDAGLAGAKFGFAVAGGSDIDGDGVPDFAVGAPGTKGAFARAGAAFVYSGASGSLLREYSGLTKDQALGSAVALLEVDGDPLADLAISSPVLATIPASGAVEIFSGQSNSLLVTIHSPTSAKSFGHALCSLDDLDGDGADDLAIGSPLHLQAAPGSANVYLVSGANGAILFAYGNSPTKLGMTLSGGDDVDGDGIDDVIAGDPTATVDDVVHCGRVHAISGATGQEIWTYTDVTIGGMIGTAVATTGDHTGDGRAETIVSAPVAEVGFVTEGRVRLLSTVQCGAVIHFGTACNDDPSVAPKLNLVGCPHSNATISLHIETYLLPTTGLLVLGTQQAALPLPSGCTLYVGLPFVAIGPFVIPGAGNALEFTGVLPPNLAPVTFYAQVIVRKEGLPSPDIDASQGLSVTVAP